MMKPTKPCCLVTDQNGAMMVLSLFMALFLIGTLYYVMGVGDAILYRRLMQDATDAGAYGASVTAARGMNLIVLLNIIMLITAGILLLVRSIENLLLIAAGIAAGSVFAAPAAPPLYAHSATVERIGDGVERFVKGAHKALDGLHGVVQYGYAGLASTSAAGTMSSEGSIYTPPVRAGFAVPLLGPNRNGLPVEEDDIDVLCDRARDEIADAVAKASGPLDKIPIVRRAIRLIVRGALRTGQRATCDDDIVKPPRRILVEREDTGGEVWLGHDEFQYRAYALGVDPHDGYWQRGEQGVRLAQGGYENGRDGWHRAHLAGQFSFSQAEYYFDGTDDREEWAWRMRWRARMRRYRPNRSSPLGSMMSGCTSAPGGGGAGLGGSVCGLLRQVMSNLVSVH